MTVDPRESSAAPRQRTRDRLRTAVRDMEPSDAGKDGASSPRGNQAPDDGEVRRGEERLSTVLGH